MTKLPLSKSKAIVEFLTCDIEFADHIASVEGLFKVRFPFSRSTKDEEVGSIIGRFLFATYPNNCLIG